MVSSGPSKPKGRRYFAVPLVTSPIPYSPLVTPSIYWKVLESLSREAGALSGEFVFDPDDADIAQEGSDDSV